MKITLLTILFLSINSVFGQNNKVEYNEIIPEYILAVWENDGTSDNAEFQITELDQIKSFLAELGKRENQITSNEFLTKPTTYTLVAHYLHKKLKWNSFNGPHIGIKKLKNKKVIKNELKNLPTENELIAHYYLSIFSDVLNKQKPMDLSKTNIDFENLNLGNDTEKAVVFLCAMRHIGGQVGSYSNTRFPENCFRAKEYVENMPKFNGKFFYEYQLPEFKDFKIEVDKRYPKMSFKERYLPEFEKAKIGYEKCIAKKN
ncbi:hypothetical protein ES731_15195 [Psychroflexus gondwanensis]|uniref:hypothetical protein n=1 Tax=Psychroflexus gondwanensis TaxID=251 RepID=UPI0011BF4816|nr:hypothetical protein [Psychroflexus gondwanensis]TXE15618.1 hypothetical protein ES731_15190 [Psychroflexus gondwanensis]TXE15619.1 hypothetical protein ES731_15195 [Psychroflexus gondwanensis]